MEIDWGFSVKPLQWKISAVLLKDTSPPSQVPSCCTRREKLKVRDLFPAENFHLFLLGDFPGEIKGEIVCNWIIKNQRLLLFWSLIVYRSDSAANQSFFFFNWDHCRAFNSPDLDRFIATLWDRSRPCINRGGLLGGWAPIPPASALLLFVLHLALTLIRLPKAKRLLSTVIHRCQ